MEKPKTEKRKHVKRKKPGPVRPGQHLLLKPQVLELLGGCSYPTLWGMMKNFDFPHPIVLGPPEGRTSRVAWIATEVYEWIALRPRHAIGHLKEIRKAQVKVSLARSKIGGMRK